MGLHFCIYIYLLPVCPKPQYSNTQTTHQLYCTEKEATVKFNFVMIIIKVLYAFQFVIVGTFGETHQTDIAVDAVCVTPCGGEKASSYNNKYIVLL